MIAVEMRDQDEVDIVSDDAEPFQRRQRRGAAIDQEIDVAAGDVKTGVVAATGTQRVAAADKLQLHRSDPSGFIGKRRAASPDSATPATRHARRNAPAARPTARHCPMTAASATRR